MSRSTGFKMDDELYAGITRHLKGTKSISQFAYEAAVEKVSRMDARDDRARMQILAKNKELLKPIIREILEEMK